MRRLRFADQSPFGGITRAERRQADLFFADLVRARPPLPGRDGLPPPVEHELQFPAAGRASLVLRP